MHNMYLKFASLVFLSVWFWLEWFQTLAETLTFGMLVQSWFTVLGVQLVILKVLLSDPAAPPAFVERQSRKWIDVLWIVMLGLKMQQMKEKGCEEAYKC